MKKKNRTTTENNIFKIELNQSSSSLPSEVQLLPAESNFYGFDGREFKATDKTLIAIYTNSNLKYLPIDENHSIDHRANFGRSTPALGWMSGFYVKEDNTLWAKVEWTDKGKELISKKEYKYISPVFNVRQNREITAILRAGLTNNPNLNLTALNSAEKTPAVENNTTNKNKDKNKSKEKNMPELNNKMAQALGLSETATVEEAIAEINSLKAKNEVGKGYVKKEELNAEIAKREEAEKSLKEVNEKYSKTQSEALQAELNSKLDKAVADGKIAPSTRKFYEDLCMKEGNTTSLDEFLKVAPKVLSFEENKFQGQGGGVELNAEEAEFAKLLGYTDEEYKKLKEQNK